MDAPFTPVFIAAIFLFHPWLGLFALGGGLVLIGWGALCWIAVHRLWGFSWASIWPLIIILDLNMPRMDGHEFLTELRKDPDHCDSVVFVLTTSQADEDRAASYDKNVAGFIVKSDVGEGFLKVTTLLDSYWRVVLLPE